MLDAPPRLSGTFVPSIALGSLHACADSGPTMGPQSANARIYARAVADLPHPPTPVLVHAYDAQVLLEPDVVHGATPLGTRIRVPIVGGTFEGPRLRGRIVPGGADWQLLRADGWYVIEADYFMETHDGVAIHVHNEGLWCDPGDEHPQGYALTSPVFEAPLGAYGWLNQRIFTCRIRVGAADEPPAVHLTIWELTMGEAAPRHG